MDPKSDWTGEHRIIDAHACFRGETEPWLVGKPALDGNRPPGTEDQRVEALSSALRNRLLVAAINLPFGADAKIILYALNDRGTPLLKAHLILNWVFRRGEELGGDAETWSETHWVEFDHDWWREEIQLERQARSRIDINLHYWLTMRVREEIPSEQALRVFSSHARPRTSNLTDAEAYGVRRMAISGALSRRRTVLIGRAISGLEAPGWRPGSRCVGPASAVGCSTVES